jgi:hypothetical protein
MYYPEFKTKGQEAKLQAALRDSMTRHEPETGNSAKLTPSHDLQSTMKSAALTPSKRNSHNSESGGTNGNMMRRGSGYAISGKIDSHHLHLQQHLQQQQQQQVSPRESTSHAIESSSPIASSFSSLFSTISKNLDKVTKEVGLSSNSNSNSGSQRTSTQHSPAFSAAHSPPLSPRALSHNIASPSEREKGTLSPRRRTLSNSATTLLGFSSATNSNNNSNTTNNTSPRNASIDASIESFPIYLGTQLKMLYTINLLKGILLLCDSMV